MRSKRGFLRTWYKKALVYVLPSRRNAYRPHLLRKKWLLFFLTVTLTAEGVFLANILARESAHNYLAAVLPLDIISLTNIERSQHTIAALKENSLLTQAARAKAEDMAQGGYFSHMGPDGKEPWAWIRESGYGYAAAGENLAVRFHESADVVRAWMSSPGHRANIIRSGYTEIGVGVAKGIYQGTPATYVVQYFARPQGVNSPLPPPVVIGPTSVEVGALGAASVHSVSDSIVRNVIKLGTEPSKNALYLLVAVALIVLVLLGITFFKHIQIQPSEMLAGGAVVAVIAVSFITLDLTILSSDMEGAHSTQAIDFSSTSVVVGEEGITTLVSEI